jgi:hypothetical protein
MLPGVARKQLLSVVIGTSTAARNCASVSKTKIARSAVAMAAGGFARPKTKAGKFLSWGIARSERKARGASQIDGGPTP